MKAWVVLCGWHYEGYAEPSVIFSTLEKAEEFAAILDLQRFDFVSIEEYEFDSLEGSLSSAIIKG
jgi:hypothetical protein